MSITMSERPLGPHRSSHRRSNSNIEVGLRPPRYSSIEGAFPPAHSAQDLPEPVGLGTAAQNDRRPPRYSSVFDRERGERDRRQRVRRSGSYRLGSSAAGPQLHEYNIRTGNGAKAPAFATLRLYSRSSASPAANAAASSMRVPKFAGADLVQGSLDLTLDPPQNINAISLTLRGRIVTSAYDGGSYTFLEHPIVAWTRAHGDPRAMLLAPLTDLADAAAGARTKKFEGKLTGNYSWPFSFPFPQEVHLKDGQTSPAPQSFAEKAVRGSVQYELVVRMSHGILRSDSKLHAQITYTPEIKPAPSSTLRQIAYGEHLGMPGPHVDPMGWHELPSTTIRGTIFRERNIKLQCTLSLARPLSYTRGTIIPCHISIESSDAQGLDVLATPKALRLRLVRRVQYHDEGAAPAQGKVRSASSSSSCELPRSVAEVCTEIESAAWWVNAEHSGAHTAKRRELEGEIHLDKNLQPSCDFALFKVSYAVELLAFATPVFQLQTKGGSATPIPTLRKSPEETIISHPVTIATTHGEGPVPIAFTQPTPRTAKKVQARAYSPTDSLAAIAGVGAYI